MSMRALLCVLALFGAWVPGVALGQFVYPKPEYHNAEPGLYTEDPFIVKWRREYFAVFRGDLARFRRAHAEIKAMVEADPKDARAMVWYGNGQMVEAGLQMLAGKNDDAKALVAQSRKTLDRAVELSPEDANIYMMRAATLVLIGERFPKDWYDDGLWKTLRDDCLRFIAFIGPERMPRTSIHLRGEAYGCLGLAYARLGETAKARAAFETVIRMNPETGYSERAQREIALLDSSQ